MVLDFVQAALEGLLAFPQASNTILEDLTHLDGRALRLDFDVSCRFRTAL